LKTLISLGGADASATSGFASAAATCGFLYRSIHRRQCRRGRHRHRHLYGNDIDWEFPVRADTTNATALVKEFRDQLNALGEINHKHYLLTMFAPAGAPDYSSLELAKVAKQLDYCNLQGYDLHGTGRHRPITRQRCSSPDRILTLDKVSPWSPSSMLVWMHRYQRARL
jgi:chitinase